MQRRQAARLGRLSDARTLAIGVDTGALKEQVDEKRRSEAQRQQDDAAYAQYAAKVNEVASLRAAAEHEAVLEANDALRADWAAAAQEAKKKELSEQHQQREDDTRHKKVPLMTFEGEDRDVEARVRRQAEAATRAFAEQKQQKEARARRDRDEDSRYASYEKYVLEKRGALEAAQHEQRRLELALLKKTNDEAALRKRERAKDLAEQVALVEAQEVRGQRACPELCEDTAVAVSQLGPHRYRPDHFKGFSPEKVAALRRGNATLVADKKRLVDQDQRALAQYHAFQTEQLAYANDSFDVFLAERRLANTTLAREHRAQASLDAHKRKQHHQDAFGAATFARGYLAGFGTSAR